MRAKRVKAQKRNRQIFLGAGDHSGAECYKLHKLLAEALEELCGIQQGGVTKEEYEETQLKIRRNAQQIYESLTGQRPWLWPYTR